MKPLYRELSKVLPGIAAASVVIITVSIMLIIHIDPSRPPNSVIIVSSYQAPLGTPIEFDGTNSTDPDGGAVSYRWDINGTWWSSEPSFLFTFPSPGAFNVTLEVRDREGDSDSSSVEIHITPADTARSMSFLWETNK